MPYNRWEVRSDKGHCNNQADRKLESENAILREALSEYLKSVEIARDALARRSKKET